MTIDLSKLKALAEAAMRDPYDHLAANDYGMSMPPARALELIAEIERHRLVNAEGCKPDSSILLSSAPCAGAAPCRSLDKAEGCKPDLINSPFFYALAGPDGRPHYDDFCVADNPADLECHEEGITILPLYAHPQHHSDAVRDVLAERRRQIELKGYTSEHDDLYGCGELTAYAVTHALLATGTMREWPSLDAICTWEVKDDEPRSMLIKAAALILAALESLDRQPVREAQL